MQARKFPARRFQLHSCGVGREVTNIGPVDHFHGTAAAHKRRRQPSPQSREAYVGARYSPIIRGFDDLNIVDSHDALAINVDHLLVQHVAREQNFPVASCEGPQVEDV